MAACVCWQPLDTVPSAANHPAANGLQSMQVNFQLYVLVIR